MESTFREIIESLAKSDPRSEEGYCQLCCQFTSSSEVIGGYQENVVEMHSEDCPWRLAKETLK